MPELPEIETITRGIQNLTNQTIVDIVIRNPSLRYPITEDLKQNLINKNIKLITRRAKYIILHLNQGYLLIHLGMSGRLTLNSEKLAETKHDHFDLVFKKQVLRYNDPRRFGCIIYTEEPNNHILIKNLGPEPLTAKFNTEYLLTKLTKKTSTIKQLIMDNYIVVGVGNIYACEALYQSKILPTRLGHSISSVEAKKLVQAIKDVLKQAIELGGSTLRDYKQADGKMGYFQNVHNVYGRVKKPCKICNTLIIEKRIGQRNSFYCPNCQK